MPFTPLIPEFGNIPKVLQALARWIVWKAVVKKDGKVDKVPHDHRIGRSCDVHDPDVWSSFEDICTVYASGLWDGIGVLPGEGILGVDLDKCRDPETGDLDLWALEVIKKLGSYAEASPSGTGVRIFLRGLAPGPRKKKGKVEMYDGNGGNFLTVTGHVLPGSPPDVIENQEGIDWLYAKFLAGDEKSIAAAFVIAGESRLSDEQVLESIRSSAQGERFAALFDDGDTSEHGDDDSAADMALMTMLAWWTGSDPEQMERIFSESQLAQRDKWLDRTDYRRRTIAAAIKANGGKHFHGQTPVMTPKEAFTTVECQHEAGWPEFIPFDERPPDLPHNLLPGLLGEFSEALSEAIQAPRELAAINALGVIALAVQGRSVVRVKPDYYEPLNVYGLVACEPGERKSAVVSACKAPLVEWERERSIGMQNEIRQAQSHRKTAEKAIDHARQRAAKAKAPEEREAAKAEVFAMETELPVVPVPPRLLCDDITPEALAEALASHGESLGVLEAEGGLFEILNGRYSNGVPNFDVALKAFGGEPVRVDRKGKDSIHLQSPRLSLVLSPQPAVLASALQNTAFMGRGLIARFLLVLPLSRVGYRTNSNTLDEALAEKWTAFIYALLDVPADIEPVEITLCQESYKLWLAFTDKVEKAQRPGGEFEHIRPWASKLSGLVIRIAGLFHIVERAGASLEPISGSTMGRAVRFAEWAAQHAKYVLCGFSVATEGTLKVAHAIFGWLQRERREEVTGRDIHQALRSRFSKKATLQPGLDELVERGALVRKTTKPSIKGGPAKKVYLVNPAVYPRIDDPCDYSDL